MIIKDLKQIGDPHFKQKLNLVKDFSDSELLGLVKDLKDTLYIHELVGLAANQIGGSFRVFVTEVRKTKFRNPLKPDPLRVYINPEIIYYSEEMEESYEGCGSVAYSKLFAPVIRSNKIEICAKNINGKEFTLEAEGLLARVIQHEVDHLNNIEFIEKVSDWSKAMSSEEYRRSLLS
ncbi:peptide deformylase [Candidatus Dojkabacteria bacterium]|uniref:Peptide deformylase n=1 Tax=Candidatus Dojkabacteria bacterium TaxID=2099670 RepID=A0A955I893_9BACT|nr:peptide deformylase [Candidatus Dojkabacteria bacterium]